MEFLLTLILYTGVSICSTLLFSKACRRKKRRFYKMAILLAVGLPSLMAALRGSAVGSDTLMYIREYYAPGSWLFGSGFTRSFELGFRLLRDALFALGMPHQVEFFVVQAATLSFLFAAAKEESDEINLKVTMFIYMFDAYFQSFNMMRQALAVAIVVYSFTQIVGNKKIKGLCFILLAVLFHSSAIVCFVVVIVKFVLERKHTKAYISIGSVLIILLIFNNTLVRRIAIFFFGDKAIWYTTVSDTGSHLWVYFLKITPIIILLVLCIRNFSDNKKVIVYSGIVLAGYLLAAYGNFVASNAQRVALYASRLDAIVLGYAVNKELYLLNGKYLKTKQTRNMVYIYFIIMYIYNYFYLGVSKIVPYSVY